MGLVRDTIENALVPFVPKALRRPVTEIVAPDSDPPWAMRTAPGPHLAKIVNLDFERQIGIPAPRSMRDFQGVYTGNGPRWVYACAAAIGQDVAALPIRAINVRTREVVPFPHRSLIRPNPDDTFQELLEAIVIDKVLIANGFFALDPGSQELIRLNPPEVRIYPGEDGYVRKYGIERNGIEQFIPAELVAHCKLHNPANRYWGTGPSQALRHTMVIARGEDSYLIKFFDRGARPSGFISLDPEANSDAIERVQEEIEDGHVGSEKHGGILILAGAKYEAVQSSPVDSGYIEIQKITKEEFLGLYGVPPFRLALQDKANYANAREQERVYFETTIIPMGRRIVRRLNHWRAVVPFPELVMLELDEQEIRARFRDEEMLARTGEILVRSAIMSRDRVRDRYFHEPPLEDEDVPQFGQLPIQIAGFGGPTDFDADVDGDAPEAQAQAVTDEAVDPTTALNGAQVVAMLDVIKSVSLGELPRTTGVQIIAAAFPISLEQAEQIMSTVGGSFTPTPPVVPSAAPAPAPAEPRTDGDGEPRTFTRAVHALVHNDKDVRAVYTRALTARRRRQQARLEAIVGQTTRGIARAVMDIVETHDRGVRQDEIPQELRDALIGLDFSRFSGEILDAWIPEILSILAEEARAKVRLTGLAADVFNVQDPAIIEFITREGAELVQHVEDSTRDAIRQALAASQQDGETVEQLTARLQSAPAIGNDRVRARRIAVTETAAATGFGSQNALEQARAQGVKLGKSWLTVGDGNVRASHSLAENDGVIGIDDVFSNGMRFPGDPNAPVGERINERCDLIPEVQED